MSIPNRVAAPTTKASWVARVICPRAPEPFPNARAIRMFIAKLAITKTPSPTMFWPVPARIVRRSRVASAVPEPSGSLSDVVDMRAKYAGRHARAQEPTNTVATRSAQKEHHFGFREVQTVTVSPMSQFRSLRHRWQRWRYFRRYPWHRPVN